MWLRDLPNDDIGSPSDAVGTIRLDGKREAAASGESYRRASSHERIDAPSAGRTTTVIVMAHRIFGLSFASIYPLYVEKVERKGHPRQEADEVICWLTGYDEAGLEGVIAEGIDLETFFARAPRMNPNAGLITGVICGLRVEDIEDPLMQKIRYMDKLVDEVARGKRMASILREPKATQPRP
jgi:hypothetical protein